MHSCSTILDIEETSLRQGNIYICVLSKRYVENLTLTPQNMILFGNGIIIDVIS